MINFENCLLKVLKLVKKTNANNKRSIEIFVNKTLHLKPINNKKQVVKKNTDEFKHKGDTQLLMSKKCKTELRMMMMMDLMIMVMMITMMMIMMTMTMIMMTMTMTVVIVVMMMVILLMV